MYAPQPTGALVEAGLAPPPARVEGVPHRPVRSAVWLDGEWAWRRDRWSWLPGRWVEAPVGASFSPWVFVRGAQGSLWVAPGTWRDAQGAPVDAPAPIAVAAVYGGPVVNASGAVERTGRVLKPPGAPRTRVP
jgi:hypothetical protein